MRPFASSKRPVGYKFTLSLVLYSHIKSCGKLNHWIASCDINPASTGKFSRTVVSNSLAVLTTPHALIVLSGNPGGRG